MKLVHLSDIHVWRYTWDPRRLTSKRFLGMMELLRGRARRFQLERMEAVVERVLAVDPDHILITGDLTTTALPAEFRDARRELAPLLVDPSRVTVLPGNHDRYTTHAARHRTFEVAFGDLLPEPDFPWLRRLDEQTALLGLDPTRPHISARGYLPPEQFDRARALIADPATRPRRLIVACHYPAAAPPLYERELAFKKLKNDDEVRQWLAGVGPHLYCCGHVHAAWAHRPPEVPGQLCLNAGAPLLRDHTGFRLPGFLQVELEGDGVRVTHEAWTGMGWIAVPLVEDRAFFAPVEGATPVPTAAPGEPA
jgi:3',5'-cyclic AMP phosphodiesterase CpdA